MAALAVAIVAISCCLGPRGLTKLLLARLRPDEFERSILVTLWSSRSSSSTWYSTSSLPTGCRHAIWPFRGRPRSIDPVSPGTALIAPPPWLAAAFAGLYVMLRYTPQFGPRHCALSLRTARPALMIGKSAAQTVARNAVIAGGPASAASQAPGGSRPIQLVTPLTWAQFPDLQGLRPE